MRKKYIAFLRGINVGGKNKLSMSELKKLLKESGFEEVVTYINSGNIIFESAISDEKQLREACEKLIQDRFNMNIPVAVISYDVLLEAIRNAPPWWGKDKDSKHNAMFVLPPMTAEEVMLKVGEAKPEYEQVDFYGSVIFWSAPISTFSKTRWSKVVGSSVYEYITIRNANTVRKVLEI